MSQYVYTLRRVQDVPPSARSSRTSRSNFFHRGDRIGVLGLNGSAKIHVAQVIMAGEDKNFEGEVVTCRR